MKKIIYMSLTVLLTLTLASCKKEENIDYGTYAFENKTIQTSSEVQEKIEDYILKIEDIIEKKIPYNFNLDPGTYQRDELPESIPYEQTNSTFLPYQEIKYVLQVYNSMLKGNDFFEEDAFNDYDNLSYQTKLKIRLEDNQLYIQAFDYRIKNEYGDKSVDETLIYFNIVEENLYFEYAKDKHATYGIESPLAQNDNGNQIHYYKFIENGDKAYIFIDNFNENRYAYETRTKDNRIIFMFYTSGEHLRVKFSNKNYDKLYEYYVNSSNDLDEIESTVTYISDTKGLSFKAESNGVYRMEYNLLEVDGWNRVTDQPDKIFNDDQVLLDDLSVTVYVDITTLIRVTTSAHKDSFTSDDLNLSSYGLSYDLKSKDQVLDDIEYVKGNFMDAINDYGLENNTSNDKAYLLSELPFEFDQAMIDQLFSTL
ncbi:MAG: hypothetical protein K8Q99_01450 [Acholeplasmataceae bacterium]|nr:hypothetical protein [Acholeplasmataceae bacterium]